MENFAFYLTKAKGSDRSVWLEGVNSPRPLEAQIRFVSKDLPQVNVSTLLLLVKSFIWLVRRVIRVRTKATSGKAFLFSELMPGDEPLMCSTPRSTEIIETWCL